MKNENNKTTNNTKTITEINCNNEKIKKIIEKNNIKNENISSKQTESTKQTKETPIQKNLLINKDEQKMKKQKKAKQSFRITKKRKNKKLW